MITLSVPVRTWMALSVSDETLEIIRVLGGDTPRARKVIALARGEKMTITHAKALFSALEEKGIV